MSSPTRRSPPRAASPASRRSPPASTDRPLPVSHDDDLGGEPGSDHDDDDSTPGPSPSSGSAAPNHDNDEAMHDEDQDEDDRLDALASKSTLLVDRLAKLKQLRIRMHQTETDNRKDLVAEQNSKRVPHAVQRKLERNRKEALALLEKRDLEAAGQDYDRVKNLSYSIQDVEAWEERQSKKRERENSHMTDLNQAAQKKYKRMIADLKPDLDAYEEQRATAELSGTADAFYGDTNALDVSSKPSRANVDRMVTDLQKQIEIRQNSSRRRAVDPSEDVAHISEKNRVFNQKLARAYDKYTSEIKESLERGTAL
ncbi:hypothetical protein GGF31_004182 [Allomyces arbusculus]|nr:hypothetical protein GGF31_004182 [Allomyces arbusculus]